MRTHLCSRWLTRACGFLPLALGILLPAARAGTPTSGLLYYTRYQSPADVNKVNYYYDGTTNFVFSNAVVIVDLNGADGLTVAADGSLIVGACGSGTISKVNPLTGSYVTVPSGGGACHLALDPNRQRAWAGFTYSGSSALSEIPLVPSFGNGIAHPVTGDDTSAGTLAWDAGGYTYYTVSSPGGNGNFGVINMTNFTTHRLLTGVPAAHGMAYDPFSGTFLLFGSTHVSQVLATPSNATVIGDLTFPVSALDQGTVDARGHILVADNGGNIVFIDYSGSGYLTNTSTYSTTKYLDSYLDDVAPVGLVGSPYLADMAVTTVVTPNPAMVRSNLVFTLTVTNAGPAGATNIVLNDTLPPNSTYISAVSSLGACGLTNGVVTCTAPSLTASNSFTVTITVQPISGPQTNQAVVLADDTDPDFANNVSDVVVPAPYACLPPAAGVISWWPGDGSANDMIGTNNGTLSVTNAYSFVPGMVGGAFGCDGVSSYVLVNDSVSLRPTNVTLECWVFFNRADGCRVIMGKPLGGGSADSYVLWVQDGTLNATVYYQSGNGPVLSYALNPAPGVWYHLAYTVDSTSGNQVLYVNAQPVATAVAGGVLQYDTHPFLIGADINNGGYNCLFSGRIDEPTVYGRALTATEIQSIFLAGPQGKCGAPVIVPATLMAAETNIYYSQPITLAHAAPPFTFSKIGGTLPPGMSFQSDGSFFGIPTAVGSYTFTVQGTDAFNEQVQSNLTLNVLPCLMAPEGLLAWWRGESNALDELGQHNGIINGGVTFSPGYDGYCFNLNGQNAYIDVGPWSPGTRWTVEAWVNPAVSPSGRHAIVADYATCQDWGIALQDGQFVATIRQPGGCSMGIPSGFFPQVGMWYHVAETVDGTNGIIYVNGTPYATNAVDPNYFGATSDTRIGSSVCCGEYFYGLVDEAAIYNRALAPAEINALYSASVAGKCAIGPVPVITMNPTNTTGSVFGSASLCAAASGVGTLSYQWYHNGIPVPGATGSCLNFPTLSAANEGIYWVTVSNTNGTVVSASAALTVIDLNVYAGVTINGIVGAQYEIDYSNDLVSWTTLTTFTLPSTPYVYIDTTSGGQPHRYYRVRHL
jgi:uncharacterized repeat protein (TIGR01451 family)